MGFWNQKALVLSPNIVTLRINSPLDYSSLIEDGDNENACLIELLGGLPGQHNGTSSPAPGTRCHGSLPSLEQPRCTAPLPGKSSSDVSTERGREKYGELQLGPFHVQSGCWTCWPESALSFPGLLMGHVSFKLSVVSTFKHPGTKKTSEAIVEHLIDLFR